MRLINKKRLKPIITEKWKRNNVSKKKHKRKLKKKYKIKSNKNKRNASKPLKNIEKLLNNLSYNVNRKCEDLSTINFIYKSS